MYGFEKDDETILHAITDHAGAQLENMDLCRRAAENRTVGWSLVKSLDVYRVLYVLKRWEKQPTNILKPIKNL